MRSGCTLALWSAETALVQLWSPGMRVATTLPGCLRPLAARCMVASSRSYLTAPLVQSVLSAYWLVVLIFLVLGLAGSLERDSARARERESFVHCGMVWAVHDAATS